MKELISSESFSFREAAIKTATWLDALAESAKNKNVSLKDGTPLQHKTVWLGIGIAALTGIKMISNMESNGNVNLT